MATQEVGIRLSLKGRRETAKGLKDTADDVGKVETKLRRLGRAGAAASDGMDRAVRAGGRFGAIGAGVAVAGIATAGFALSRFVSDAAESAKVSRITEAAIKSTGGAAKITGSEIGSLAEALSNKTAIDDEAIQSAQNMLLSFTNIRNEAGKGNDIFNQASAAVLDYSVRTGVDATGAATALGKALNDPIKGVTALGKAGVQFTKDQKEQIKRLVESGDLLGAQKVILGELTTQFGGSAEAAADPIARLSTIVGNLGERVGTIALPYVERFATFLIDTAVPAADKFFGEFERGVGAGGDLRDRISELVGGAQRLWTEFQTGAGTGGQLREALGTAADAALMLGEITRDVIVPAIAWLNDHPNALAGIVGGMVALRVATQAAVFWQLALNTAQAAGGFGGGAAGKGGKVPGWVKAGSKVARVAGPVGAALAVGAAIYETDDFSRDKQGNVLREQPGDALAGPGGQAAFMPTYGPPPTQVKSPPPPRANVPAARSGSDSRQPMQVTVQSVLDGRVVAESTTDHLYAREARR